MFSSLLNSVHNLANTNNNFRFDIDELNHDVMRTNEVVYDILDGILSDSFSQIEHQIYAVESELGIDMFELKYIYNDIFKNILRNSSFSNDVENILLGECQRLRSSYDNGEGISPLLNLINDELNTEIISSFQNEVKRQLFLRFDTNEIYDLFMNLARRGFQRKFNNYYSLYGDAAYQTSYYSDYVGAVMSFKSRFRDLLESSMFDSIITDEIRRNISEKIQKITAKYRNINNRLSDDIDYRRNNQIELIDSFEENISNEIFEAIMNDYAVREKYNNIVLLLGDLKGEEGLINVSDEQSKQLNNLLFDLSQAISHYNDNNSNGSSISDYILY